MRYNREREQAEFVDNICLKLPKHWRELARGKHSQLAKNSLKRANLYLLDLSDAIEGAIDIGASDDDLVNLSIDLVNRVRVLQSESIDRSFNLQELLEALCLEFGVRFPVEHDNSQRLARMTDAAWWVRGLRVSHAKRAEGAAIDAGLVSKKADVYCSQDTLDRRGAQRRRTAAAQCENARKH